MLKAKHHFFIYPFFQYYTLWELKRKFHRVEMIGNFEDENKPILLIANHVSWWDGFWAMYLNLKQIKRKFHFMMQEDQLMKYRFFNLTGAFSISKNSREMIESLKYTSDLLVDKQNLVLMYPQGKIYSIYEDNFIFQKGIERILSDKKDKIQLIFSANLVDYFSNSKPSLFVYFQTYKGEYYKQAIEAGYNDFYKQSINHQKQINTE